MQDHVPTTYLADPSSPPSGTGWFYQLHAVDAAGNRDNPHLTWTRAYAQASYTGTWAQGASADCDGGTGGYRAVNSAASANATAAWSFGVEESGTYAVSTRYVQGGNRSAAARYTVYDQGGSALTPVNQQTGGCAWVSLGSHTLRSGQTYSVVLDNQGTPGQYVIADSVRWVKE